AQVAQAETFGAPIADLSLQRQGPLEKIAGFLEPPLPLVEAAQVVQTEPQGAAVADLAQQRQGLLVEGAGEIPLTGLPVDPPLAAQAPRLEVLTSEGAGLVAGLRIRRARLRQTTLRQDHLRPELLQCADALGGRGGDQGEVGAEEPLRLPVVVDRR